MRVLTAGNENIDMFSFDKGGEMPALTLESLLDAAVDVYEEDGGLWITLPDGSVFHVVDDEIERVQGPEV
jgi:hypothetical protein